MKVALLNDIILTMKDQGPRYDPIVAQILGFNPNPVAHSDYKKGYDSREVPSDIALEFARRMRNLLDNTDGMRFGINAPHLLTTTLTKDTAARTYYACLPERSARSQIFTKTQELTFTKNPRSGFFELSRIFMNFNNEQRPWVELLIDMPKDKAVTIQAVSEVPSLDLRVEYLPNESVPSVFLNRSHDALSDYKIPSESNSGFLTFECSPSSAIVPAFFRREQVQTHLGMGPGNSFSSCPNDTSTTSDKTYFLSRDPLRASMILWNP